MSQSPVKLAKKPVNAPVELSILTAAHMKFKMITAAEKPPGVFVKSLKFTQIIKTRYLKEIFVSFALAT